MTPPVPSAYWLGRQPYEPVWQAMQTFTRQRDEHTPDQFWCLEHDPVYTLGRAADPSHILLTNNIPVVRSDRGGQVTYHGPGQLVIYPLLDLRRLGLGTRRLVQAIEQAIVDYCASFDITAAGKRDAPGVYVEDRKIASLGLRIIKQCSLHGLAINIDLDLTPFLAINPCGYQGLTMTTVNLESANQTSVIAARQSLIQLLCEHLGLPNCQIQNQRTVPFTDNTQTSS